MDLVKRLKQKYAEYREEKESERKAYLEEFRKEKVKALKEKARKDARAKVFGNNHKKSKGGSGSVSDWDIFGLGGSTKKGKKDKDLWDW